MSDNINITFKDMFFEVEKKTKLSEIVKQFREEYNSSIVAARVNNDIKDLSHELVEDSSIKFIDLTDEDGMRIYRRSLYFIFIKAVNELFPERNADL